MFWKGLALEKIILLTSVLLILVLNTKGLNSHFLGEYEYYLIIRGHLVSKYAKISEKLSSLTAWYAHVPVGIKG